MKKKENCLKKLTVRFWSEDIIQKLNKIHNDTGLPLNEIISDCIRDMKIVIDNSKEEHNELLKLVVYHLSRIGNNLNQLTKLAKVNKEYLKNQNIEKILDSMVLELNLLRTKVLNDK